MKREVDVWPELDNKLEFIKVVQGNLIMIELWCIGIIEPVHNGHELKFFDTHYNPNIPPIRFWTLLEAKSWVADFLQMRGE